METFAPGGVDATEISRGPLCTMVAHPVSTAEALTIVAKSTCLNIAFSSLDLERVSSPGGTTDASRDIASRETTGVGHRCHVGFARRAQQSPAAIVSRELAD